MKFEVSLILSVFFTLSMVVLDQAQADSFASAPPPAATVKNATGQVVGNPSRGTFPYSSSFSPSTFENLEKPGNDFETPPPPPARLKYDKDNGQSSGSFRGRY